MKITVTDDQARKFFDENPAKFEQPEMVRAAHILISTRSTDPDAAQAGGRPGMAELSDAQKAAKKKLADDVLKRARAGEDFAKLAKQYSEDPFPRGQMLPEFEAAAFSLGTNQISDIVTTTYGYHIIKLYEKMPAKKLDFEKEATGIKEYLAQREIQKQYPQFIQKLRKDADVQILDEHLKAVELPSPAAAAGPDGAVEPAKK